VAILTKHCAEATSFFILICRRPRLPRCKRIHSSHTAWNSEGRQYARPPKARPIYVSSTDIILLLSRGFLCTFYTESLVEGISFDVESYSRLAVGPVRSGPVRSGPQDI